LTCVEAHNADVDDLRCEVGLKFTWLTPFAVLSFVGSFDSREGGWGDSMALINCFKNVNNVFTATQSSLWSPVPSSHFSTTLFGSLPTIKGTRIGAKVSDLNLSPMDSTDLTCPTT